MNFYWKSSLSALNSISGLASGDRGIVVTDGGDVSFYGYNGSAWVQATGGLWPAEVVVASTGSLTAAQVTNTILNNYGQTAENTQTLPTAASGMNGIVTIGTSGAGAFHLKAGASDKIYLDGVALDDGDKVSFSTPVVGDYFMFWSFKTGSASWDWIVRSGEGTLTDGGA